MLLQLSKTVKQSPKSPQIFENNGAFCADRPFSKNRSETNCQKSFVFNQLVSELQSYILSTTTETLPPTFDYSLHSLLQSYILSTTTETGTQDVAAEHQESFNRTSFQQQLKLNRCITWQTNLDSFNRTSFQQQLKRFIIKSSKENQTSFNRTSFQQQLKRLFQNMCLCCPLASIVHPFNNNWNSVEVGLTGNAPIVLQSYILSTTTETLGARNVQEARKASIVHPFNNNWNDWPGPKFQPFTKLQSYILSTTTETKRSLQTSRQLEASIVHPFNNNWNFGAWCFLCISRSFNRTSFQQQLKRF